MRQLNPKQKDRKRRAGVTRRIVLAILAMLAAQQIGLPLTVSLPQTQAAQAAEYEIGSIGRPVASFGLASTEHTAAQHTSTQPSLRSDQLQPADSAAIWRGEARQEGFIRAAPNAQARPLAS
jgi:hypothetical protein